MPWAVLADIDRADPRPDHQPDSAARSRTTLKIAALAPMPNASVTTTVTVRALARVRERKANRISRASASARFNPAVVPDAPHLLAHGRQIAELHQRRAACRSQDSSPRSIRCLIFDRQVAADSSVEVAFIGSHAVAPLLATWLYPLRRDPRFAHGVDQPGPAVLLAYELLLACRGQLVIPRPLVGLADAPFRLQPATLHQTMQRWIERAGFDLEEMIRLRADRLTNAVAVVRSPLPGFEESACRGFPGGVPGCWSSGCVGHSRRQSTAWT